MGSYIDALSDEQRDRVIEAKSWSPPEDGWFVDEYDHSCRCLVGHAADWRRIRCSVGSVQDAGDVVSDPRGAYWRFPHLQARFGTDRVIAACKARAAKGNNLAAIRSEIYEERKEAIRLVALL